MITYIINERGKIYIESNALEKEKYTVVHLKQCISNLKQLILI